MKKVLLVTLLLGGTLFANTSRAANLYLTVTGSASGTSFKAGDTISVGGIVAYYKPDGSTDVVEDGKVTAILKSSSGATTPLASNVPATAVGTWTITSDPLPDSISPGSYAIEVSATSPNHGGATTAPLVLSGIIIAGTSAATTTPPATTSDSSASTSITIPNPLGSDCNNATCLISRVIKSILGIVAIIATFMFIWGGITMLTSSGNERQVKQAKDTLTWAAIGLVVILISWAAIRFVLESLKATPKKSIVSTTTTRIVERFMV